MDPRPLEQQCWHCGLPLGTRMQESPLRACPSCGTPLRPPSSSAPMDTTVLPPPSTPDQDAGAAAAVVASAEAPRERIMTPWLGTALLALLIVMLLAGVGVVAARLGT